MTSRALDAVVVGNGPSGLAVSLGLLGWAPHLVKRSSGDGFAAPTASIEAALGEGGLAAADVATLQKMSAGLRGRSHHPLALLYDSLLHPGADGPYRGPPAIEIRHNASAALSHVVLGGSPAGGYWHKMHPATKTLSPGTWMELPSFGLAEFLAARDATMSPQDARQRAAERQPRGVIAEYYEAAATHFRLGAHLLPERAAAASWVVGDGDGDGGSCDRSGSSGGGGGSWLVETTGGRRLRARTLVLATGTAGEARRLGVPGEAPPRVAHRRAEHSAAEAWRGMAWEHRTALSEDRGAMRWQVRRASGGRLSCAGGGRWALGGRLHRASPRAGASGTV